MIPYLLFAWSLYMQCWWASLLACKVKVKVLTLAETITHTADCERPVRALTCLARELLRHRQHDVLAQSKVLAVRCIVYM
jgi:hypothetical protein